MHGIGLCLINLAWHGVYVLWHPKSQRIIAIKWYRKFSLSTVTTPWHILSDSKCEFWHEITVPHNRRHCNLTLNAHVIKTYWIFIQVFITFSKTQTQWEDSEFYFFKSHTSQIVNKLLDCDCDQCGGDPLELLSVNFSFGFHNVFVGCSEKFSSPSPSPNLHC